MEKWNFINDAVEVRLDHPDDFLKIKETLTRIGVISAKEKQLFQSCHILHKQGKYFIMHFKELFILDGKEFSNYSKEDMQRRNTIIQLLDDWGLINVIDKEKIKDQAPVSKVKIISFKDKDEWELKPKYSIGLKNKRY